MGTRGIFLRPAMRAAQPIGLPVQYSKSGFLCFDGLQCSASRGSSLDFDHCRLDMVHRFPEPSGTPNVLARIPCNRERIRRCGCHCGADILVRSRPSFPPAVCLTLAWRILRSGETHRAKECSNCVSKIDRILKIRCHRDVVFDKNGSSMPDRLLIGR